MVRMSVLFRELAAKVSEGDVGHKFLPAPKIKPKRRRPGFQNRSQDPHYQRDYKRSVKDDGKGYHKVPRDVKKWRAEQRKRLKEKFKLKQG